MSRQRKKSRFWQESNPSCPAVHPVAEQVKLVNQLQLHLNSFHTHTALLPLDIVKVLLFTN
jgi:hypothetical protein